MISAAHSNYMSYVRIYMCIYINMYIYIQKYVNWNQQKKVTSPPWHGDSPAGTAALWRFSDKNKTSKPSAINWDHHEFVWLRRSQSMSCWWNTKKIGEIRLFPLLLVLSECIYIYMIYIYICMCVYIPYIPVTNKECISISPVRKPPKNDAWNRKKWVWIKIIHAKKCVSWYTESFAICGSRGNHMTWPMPHHSSLVHSSQGGKMPTNYLRACPLQNKNWLTE